jgi:hypothetical protein
MITQKEFIIHACEQVLRFTQVDQWDNLSEKIKIQLGFNMGAVALGLSLTKEDGFMALSDARQGKISMPAFRKHIRTIINTHKIIVNEDNVSRPF